MGRTRARHKPEYLPPGPFPELDNEPLLAHLQQYFGIASDMYIHFTPEFFGRQTFTQTPQDDDVGFVELAYIADQREILFTGITMCSMHAHILLVFNAAFEQVMTDQSIGAAQNDVPPEGRGLPARSTATNSS